MKYPMTKKKRLVAIFDGYLAVTGKKSATMEEVSEWAIKTGLYPVPTRGSPDLECQSWENHFDKVIAAASPAPSLPAGARAME